MPLDPQVKVFLELVEKAGRTPTHLLPVPEAREQFLTLRKLAGDPEPVESVEDRLIKGPAGEIPIRIYRPSGDGPLPILIFFHGGGWVIGNLETIDTPLRALTNRSGYVVVSVDYRLAPEYKCPAAAEDCYAATAWAAENAAGLGADPTRLAIAGDSAGGNLAAVVAQLARDRAGPRIAYQVLIYPVTNHDFSTASYRENADGYLLTKDSMTWYWNHYLADAAQGNDPVASPLRAKDVSGLPPAFIITAEFDPLRDEGETYAARLRDAGVKVTTKRYDGMIHGFFQLSAMIDRGRQAIDDVAEALRDAGR